MGFTLPKGWDKDSDKLFIHTTGVRIQRMSYRQKEGWYLVPVDLDQPVVEFDPTPEGRDKAFEAYAKGALGPVKTKKTTKTKTKTKAKASEPEKDDDEKEKEKEKEGEEEEGEEKAESKTEESTEADQGDED